MSVRTSARQLINARQVAESLAVPVRAVYVLVDRGELPGYKVGRRLRFDETEVERFLETRRVNGAAT